MLIIVQENLVVGISAVAHHGGSDLAQPHSMSPSGAGEAEAGGHALGVQVETVHHEGRAVEMGLGEGAADFQFLANRERGLHALNAQAGDSAALAPLLGHKVKDGAKVLVHHTGNQPPQLLLAVFHLPAVEVRGLLIVVVEHLAEDSPLPCVAEALGMRAYPDVWVCFEF